MSVVNKTSSRFCILMLSFSTCVAKMLTLHQLGQEAVSTMAVENIHGRRGEDNGVKFKRMPRKVKGQRRQIEDPLKHPLYPILKLPKKIFRSKKQKPTNEKIVTGARPICKADENCAYGYFCLYEKEEMKVDVIEIHLQPNTTIVETHLKIDTDNEYQNITEQSNVAIITNPAESEEMPVDVNENLRVQPNATSIIEPHMNDIDNYEYQNITEQSNVLAPIDNLTGICMKGPLAFNSPLEGASSTSSSTKGVISPFSVIVVSLALLEFVWKDHQQCSTHWKEVILAVVRRGSWSLVLLLSLCH